MYFVTHYSLQMKENYNIGLFTSPLRKLLCHVCLGMFGATVCVLCETICTFVFEYLCKFRPRHLGSMLPLFGNKLATVCSLLKLLPCVCLQMVTLPPLIVKAANNSQGIFFVLPFALLSCSLGAFSRTPALLVFY